jgi:transposase-like protein
MTKRKTFTREFKLEALRLLDRGEKSPSDLARELGIPRNRLYKWREQLLKKGDDSAFAGRGRQQGADAELSALKREIARLKEENEILKKAATYFAKQSS